MVCRYIYLPRSSSSNLIPFSYWFSILSLNQSKGLRGAIAFSLSLNVTTEHRSVIITSTLFIVLFTTLVLGTFTAPLLERLKLKQLPSQEEIVSKPELNIYLSKHPPSVFNHLPSVLNQLFSIYIRRQTRDCYCTTLTEI